MQNLPARYLASVLVYIPMPFVAALLEAVSALDQLHPLQH